MKHIIEWHTAAPLWDRSLEEAGPERFKRFKAPVLLRFAGDAFMDELANVLADDPAKLADYVARQESWRDETVGWLPAATAEQPVKLYQPVHNRFYLVATSLVCRLAGLPERSIDAVAGESVSFVLRRLVDGNEYGWFGDRQQGTWELLEDAASVADGEERLPLFPLSFELEKRKRRLYAGLIPVASREVYETGAATVPPSDAELAGDPLADPRMATLRERILAGFQALAKFPSDSPDAEAREVLSFVLLDLAEFLQEELSSVWDAVEDKSASGLSDAENDLYQALASTLHAGINWVELLVDAEAHRQALFSQDFEALDEMLASAPLTAEHIRSGAVQLTNPAASDPSEPSIVALVQAALPPPTDTVAADNDAGNNAAETASYAIRCVYERPRCKGFITPAVSKPSRLFQLASFFDPDAPIRRLQIRMPVDTSLKGLGKFAPGGVSILLSKKLRRQMERAQQAGMKALTEGNVGAEPSFNLGVICSFSIPIITICALILLMIIVQLLNIVFWWLPLFRICFPVKR